MSPERVRYVTTRHFLKSARNLGITLEDGVKEACDNSIDANAHNIWIHLLTKPNGLHRITIIDDGCGIANEVKEGGKTYRGIEYILAFGGRIPHPHNPFAIGRFGWGLSQTASCLSKRTEVFTKTAKDTSWRYSYYDYSELENEEECFVPMETLQEPPILAAPDTGTIIVLDDVGTDDFKQVSRMANMFRRELGRVYRKFLGSGGSIKLIVHKKEGEKPDAHSIEISDPLMAMPGSREYQKLGGPSISYGTAIVELKGGNDLPRIINKRTGEPSQIKIHLARLDVEAARKYVEKDGREAVESLASTSEIRDLGIGMKNQGFYLVRNGREISNALTLNIYTRTTDHNWFRGQIEFDEEADDLFNIQTNKSRFSLRLGLKNAIQNKVSATIRQIIQDHRSTSLSLKKKRKSFGMAPSTAEVIAASIMPMLPKRKNISDQERSEAADLRKDMIDNMIEKVKENPDISEEEKEDQIQVIRNRFSFQSPCRKMFDVIGTGEIYGVRHMADECDIIINTQTPFFERVYDKITSEPEMESLVDLFLFSMGYAEHLAADSTQGKAFWENARRQVSQIAYQFVGFMPDDPS